jgi:hypothetical protein
VGSLASTQREGAGGTPWVQATSETTIRKRFTQRSLRWLHTLPITTAGHEGESDLGYTRLVGALGNLGHQVGGNTIF